MAVASSCSALSLGRTPGRMTTTSGMHWALLLLQLWPQLPLVVACPPDMPRWLLEAWLQPASEPADAFVSLCVTAGSERLQRSMLLLCV